MKIPRFLYFCFVILLSFAMGGCGAFSGSGSMRIEVEVYKGPLSEEPEIQWGELVGYLEESYRGIIEETNFVLSVLASEAFKNVSEEFKPIDTSVADILGKPYPHLPKMYLYMPKLQPGSKPDSAPEWCHRNEGPIDFFDCLILRSLYFDSTDLARAVAELLSNYHYQFHQNKPDLPELKKILMDIAALGKRFTTKGFRWSTPQTAGTSMSIKVRIAVVNFIVMATETGNQMGARAKALMKQTAEHGRDRRELGLSDHLKDTEPTDFVHLFDWLDASLSSFRYELIYWGLSGFWPNDVKDRVKIVEQLYSDHYWSKINTVYASGKGEVSMAFYKDETGNWNLKNFDNSPGKLLKAYTDLTLSLIETATDTATNFFTGGTPKALELANNFLTKAKEAQSLLQGTPTIESETRAQLNALKEKTSMALNALVRQRIDQESAFKNPTEKKRHQDESLKAIQTLLQKYKQQVEVLSEGAKTATSMDYSSQKEEQPTQKPKKTSPTS